MTENSLTVFDAGIELGCVLMERVHDIWEMRLVGVVAAPAIPEMVRARDVWASNG